MNKGNSASAKFPEISNARHCGGHVDPTAFQSKLVLVHQVELKGRLGVLASKLKLQEKTRPHEYEKLSPYKLSTPTPRVSLVSPQVLSSATWSRTLRSCLLTLHDSDTQLRSKVTSSVGSVNLHGLPEVLSTVPPWRLFSCPSTWNDGKHVAYLGHLR